MLRTAIIGFAHMHVNEIALYIANEPQTVLCAAADTQPAVPELSAARYTRAWNLENIRKNYCSNIYADWHRLLDREKPELVFVLCENDQKLAVARACAERGIDICLEKPMAMNLEEALEIRAMVKSSGIRAVVNWPIAWRKNMHLTEAVLNTGIVGKPLKLFYINGHTGPLGRGASHRGVDSMAQSMTDEEKKATWWYRSETGGGAFLDIGCYGCIASKWLIREQPLSAFAEAKNLATPFMQEPDHIAAVIEYPNAMSVTEASWILPKGAIPQGPVVICEDGLIRTAEDGSIVVTDIYGEVIPTPKVRISEHIENMPEHYVHAIAGEVEWHRMITLEENVCIMAMLDAEMKSARSGKKEPVKNV